MTNKVASALEAFDEDWQFVHDVVFAENHPDFNQKFKGHLWVKELFINSQYNTLKINLPMNLILAIFISIQFVVTKKIVDKIN